MADSLVLSGVRQVTKHVGQEMTRLNWPRGGNTWKMKRWWVTGGVNTVDVECTVFEVKASGKTVYLAVASNSGTRIRIDHDGNFGFTFYGMNEVDRVGLFNDSWECIEHYVFPAISGGRTMTVVPPNAADRPDQQGPDTTIGTVLVNADVENPVEGATINFAASNDGDSAFLQYAWTVTGPGGTVGGTTGSTLAVATSGPGAIEATCLISTTDPTNTDGAQSGSVVVNVVAAPVTYDVDVTIDSVNGTDGYILSGDVTGEDAEINLTAGESLRITTSLGAHPIYIKTAASTGTGDQVAEGTVTGQGATDGELTWDTTGVTAGTYYYQCSAHANMGGEIVVS